MNSENPLVSVIVPTYNSAEYLGECLHSIDTQTYSPIEILVVDNHSTDETIEIARKFTDRIYQKGPERSAQMNFGFEKANGEFYYRVDSDFFVEEEVVEEAVTLCKRGVDAVCVHNTSDPSMSFWSAVRKFERDFYEKDELNVAARFFKREVIEDVGGFDEELVAGEDYDLHNRIIDSGYSIGYTDAIEIHLDEPTTLREILIKHYKYGHSIGEFLEKNQKRGRKQLKYIRKAYRYHWRRFPRNPMLTIGFLIYQTSRYGAAGLGYLVGNWRNA